MSTRQVAFDRYFSHIAAPELRAVARHWNEVRGGRLMPAWRDIDPVAIGKYLPIIWSWRYDRATECFTGRLSGEAIVEAFGRSPRGVAMEDFFQGESYALVYARHHKVITEPCFSRDHGTVFRHVDRTGLGERIIMPLAEDGATGDGILGATVYDMAQLGPDPHASISFDNLEYFLLR